MKLILNAGELLTAVMAGAATTTNPVALTSTSRSASALTASASLSGATAVTLASCPATSADPTTVNSVAVTNVDTAAVTVTLARVTAAGTSYTLYAPTLQVGDVLVMDAAGVRVVDSAGQLKTSGATTAVVPVTIPGTDWRRADGVTALTATGTTTHFGLVYGTDGTHFPILQTLDGKAATTAVVARTIVALPPNYVSGSAITLRLNAGAITTIADASMALAVRAYARGAGPLGGSDLTAGAPAQNINSLTFANYNFAVTPTGLVAGDDLHIKVTLTVTDAATATAVIGGINHAELRCSVSQ